MTSVPVRCRDCGAEGWETEEEDLMPATCPACFEARVAPVFASAGNFAALVQGLIRVGCHPTRIRRHLAQLLAAHRE